MANPKRLLIISNETPYGYGVNFGIHAYCLEHGRWEFHSEPDRHPNLERRIDLATKQWKAHGIIAQVRSLQLEQILKRARVPVVNVSGGPFIRFPTVKADDQAIGRLAARYFLDNGFRHFGFCAVTSEPYVLGRNQAFNQELAQAGFSCDNLIDQFLPDAKLAEANWVVNRRHTDRWLRKLPKPVAILCMYDQRAQEVILACHHLGLRVPDDVAVLGIGNIDLICRMTTPALSSVDLDSRRIGFEAARLMDHLLRKGMPPDAPILILPSGVVARQSSQWTPIDDAPVAAALRYIRDNLGQAFSVKDLTNVSGMTRWGLDTHFHKQLGRSTSHEIKRLRLERAKQLLEQTSMSVEAVARACGFNDPRILCRVFRAAMDLLPSQYRRNVQGKDQP